MRPKKAKIPAEEIMITDQMELTRHVIHVNGYPALVTDSCFNVLRMLIQARRTTDDGWVKNDRLNAEPRYVSQYVWRWERELPSIDRRLTGVKLFESNTRGCYRLTVGRGGITTA